jgi:hypothetical protein
MVRPFEPHMEDEAIERVLELNVKCTGAETLDVTDLDLRPAMDRPQHWAVPVTQRVRQE